MASPARKHGESFTDFKRRRVVANRIQKLHLSSARMLWPSHLRGTYYRTRDGELK